MQETKEVEWKTLKSVTCKASRDAFWDTVVSFFV